MKNNSFTHTKAIQESFKKISQPSAIKSLRSIISILFFLEKIKLKSLFPIILTSSDAQYKRKLTKFKDKEKKLHILSKYYIILRKFKGMIGNNFVDKR